jgi:predicted methyltransferase
MGRFGGNVSDDRGVLGGAPVTVRIAALALLLTLTACTAATPPTPRSAADGAPGHSHGDRHDGGQATCTERFHDVDRWQRIFDDPARAEWQRPNELIAALAIRPGMRVADVGAGTGFFLRYLSDAVGPTGRVVAVEVETNLVSHMKNRAKDEGLSNVDVVLTPLDRLSLPGRAVDILLLVDAYHHIDRRIEYFRAAADTLAPSGRVVIVDWKPGDQPRGPRDEDHKIAPDVVEREMTAAGYQLLAAPDILPYQFVLVFARPDGTIPAR